MSNANRQVKYSIDAEDLEGKGVRYERGSFMPQIPDYLGYVLGLLIVWLVYTSYNSAVETVREPIAKISEQAVELKETVEVYAETAKAEQAIKSPAGGIVEEEDEGFWLSKLELLNTAISWAADYVSNSLQDMFPSEYDEIDNSPNERSNRQQRQSDNLSSF